MRLKLSMFHLKTWIGDVPCPMSLLYWSPDWASLFSQKGVKEQTCDFIARPRLLPSIQVERFWFMEPNAGSWRGDLADESSVLIRLLHRTTLISYCCIRHTGGRLTARSQCKERKARRNPPADDYNILILLIRRTTAFPKLLLGYGKI